MDKKITVDDLPSMFANPFLCIAIHPSMTLTHDPLVSEGIWIKAAAQYIKEIGAERFLRELLENLKGNYTRNETGNIDGYRSDVEDSSK